jgi:hypothetical protein
MRVSVGCGERGMVSWGVGCMYGLWKSGWRLKGGFSDRGFWEGKGDVHT